MAQTTRFQVFLSSTFTDLKDERAEVIQALWELDCIPTGMEAFLASNMSQWEIIQRVIDQCDYYVLILGGRYGSVTSEGISYTEKEFNYAKEIGLPILAFVHGDPQQIPVGKTEADEALRAKLEQFRQRVMKAYPVRGWENAHQLGSLVSRSLIQEMKRSPRPGWIRNDGGSPLALLERIEALTLENEMLRSDKGNAQAHIPVEDLSSGSDLVTISGTIRLYDEGTGSYDAENFDWEASVSWDSIFRNIGPLLLTEETETKLKDILGRFYQFEPDYPYEGKIIRSYGISSTSYAEIIIQLRALGLIDKGTKKRGINDKGVYWKLTDIGDRFLVGLLAKRKTALPIASLPEMDSIGPA